MKVTQLKSIFCSRFVLYFLVLTMAFPLGQCFTSSCNAAEVDGVSSVDSRIYMVEIDALELFGIVSSIRAWSSDDSALLNEEYFEPYVLSISVDSQDGNCFGPHVFYLKKGKLDQGLKAGASVLFKMNKNSCNTDEALIVIDAEVMSTEGGK